MIAKYQLRLLGLNSLEIVRTCYEWQINILNVEGWAKKLKGEWKELGLAYIWQKTSEINANKK
jgi:hypothetical protein